MTPLTPYDGATSPAPLGRNLKPTNKNGGGLSTAATLIRNASVSPAGAPRTRLWGWTLGQRPLPMNHVK
jgi:hypothetical protein